MTLAPAAETHMPVRQHTLTQPSEWIIKRSRRSDETLIVYPAEVDTGIRFAYRGAPVTTPMIPAHWYSVRDTRTEIVLGNNHGMTVRGVTPLLAALRVAGVDNAVIEVPGSRIRPGISDFNLYLDKIAAVGVATQAAARRLLRVNNTIEVRDRFGVVSLSPSDKLRAHLSIKMGQAGDKKPQGDRMILISDFTEPTADPGVVADRLSRQPASHPADSDRLLPLDDIGTLPTVLRFKAVELIGHLSLVGAPLAGNISTQSAGPQLYQALLHATMERLAVSLTSVDEHRVRYGQSLQASRRTKICPIALFRKQHE